MHFFYILLVYHESEQRLTNLQGKSQINLEFKKRIGLKYLKKSKDSIVSKTDTILEIAKALLRQQKKTNRCTKRVKT